jgi:hypothetical protein
MNKNELCNSIKFNLDQAIADFAEYVKLVGSDEGNLATLYNLEDMRDKVLKQFACDKQMADDPLIGGNG